MNLKKATKIILLAWIIIVFCFVIKSEYTLLLGRSVLLKTVPVDPRDLLMGDYVILNYEISQLPKRSSYLAEYNQPIFVKLKLNKNNIAHIDEISTEKPKGLFLKGRITTCPSTIPMFRSGKCISYGIESYYVKEKTGRKLERDLAKGALVEVSIDKYGSAKVKGFSKER